MASTVMPKGFISDAQMESFAKQPQVQVMPKKGFISDEQMSKLYDNKPDKIDSTARGAVQGISLGLADEIVGGAEALWNKANGDPAEFGNLYKKYRDESRANFKKAENANPSSYLAGEIGGGLATAAIPFGSVATIGKAAVTGARIGAINAFGQSEANNLGEAIEDVGTGVALGALGAAGGKVLEKSIPLAKGIIRGAQSAAANSADNLAAQVLSKESGSIPIDNPGIFKETAKSVKNRVKSFWNPDIDPSFEEFAAIAKKNGIDPASLPESIKFGPDSSASRSSRSIAEGRFGEETLTRFNKTLDQVRDAYDKKIINYSKGLPTDEVTAGKILRDSYDEGVTKFFNEMDITHNTLLGQVPGLRITEKAAEKLNSSLNGVEKFAKGRMVRGVTETQRGQAQQLINAVNAIRAGNGSYKQTVEALRDIGEAAFQSKNTMADVPVDVEKMRKIYNDLNESLIDSVESQLGKNVADSLVENNKLMSEFFGDKSLISKVMGDKSIAPEKAFNALILNGDTQKINALKKVISPEKFEYLKGAFLENIAKRDPEGNFTFKQLHNTMRSKKNALSSIFNEDELIENAGLVRLGDRFGNPVLSTSGTGASFSFEKLTKAPINLSVDALALRNANRSANKVLNKTTNTSSNSNVIQLKEASEALRQAPAKVASILLSTPEPKGFDKWSNDGATKVFQHDQSFTNEQLEKIKKTKSGKSLLIKASDLKPGSKAMDKIVGELKALSTSGGAN